LAGRKKGREKRSYSSTLLVINALIRFLPFLLPSLTQLSARNKKLDQQYSANDFYISAVLVKQCVHFSLHPSLPPSLSSSIPICLAMTIKSRGEEEAKRHLERNTMVATTTSLLRDKAPF